MDALIVVGVITALVLGYFLLGLCSKFILGWFPLVISSLIWIWIMHQGGYILAVLGIVLLIASVVIANIWQGSKLHNSLENKIDKLFYFKD